MKEYKIGANDAGQRLDKFLSKAVPLLPPSLMHKYIRIKRIKVNGKRGEISTKLNRGDLVSLYVNDEFFETKHLDAEPWRAVSPELTIAYEDEHIIICDKPSGMSVHEDEQANIDTLINRIKSYLYEKGTYRPENEHSFAPALCNRIDRNTAGLVIAAKTAVALRIMNDKIKQREVDKHYLCLVHGKPKPPQGMFTDFLRRDKSQKRVFLEKSRVNGALTAQTEYKTLSTRGGISLISCKLLTGRTHQIRAQFSARGMPLVGDTKYGTAAKNRGLPFKSQALCSHKVIFAFKTDAAELEYLTGLEVTSARPFFSDFYDSLR